MKVLQVTAVDFTAKKFLLPLVDNLKDNDYEVHIACNSNKIGKEIQSQGYIVKHIPFSRNFNILSHLRALIKMVALIRREKYDIIHSHTPIASLIARMAAKITKVPLNVYTAHGFYFHEEMKPLTYKITYNLEKIWGRYLTDYIFFQSKEDYQLAIKDKFKTGDKLIHINNGVSGEKFNPVLYDRDALREKLNLQGKTVILFIGRLVEEKGIRELLKAFEKVSLKNNNLALLLVGGMVEGDRDGLSPEKIVDMMPEFVKNNIHLLGLRDDIPEIIATSDIFTLPSYREGLPRSIIEAMAMGKPIIATNIRGCREEVIEGVNGLLCKSKSVESLATSLESLIRDTEKICEYGIASRRIFLEEFEEQKVLNRQLNIFNQFRNKSQSNDKDY